MKDSPQFALTLRKLALLFRRDLAVARSYRAAFAIEIFQALFGSASFYFLSRFVESPKLERSLPPGTNYFSFALVGIAFFDYLSVALITFDGSLQEARQNGTLENLLVTQTSLPVILAGSSLYPFVLMSLRTAIYIGWGAVPFGFSFAGGERCIRFPSCPCGCSTWRGSFRSRIPWKECGPRFWAMLRPARCCRRSRD